MIRRIVRAMGIVLLVAIVGVFFLYLYNTRFLESKDPRVSAPVSTKFIDIGGETIAYGERDNHASTTVIFIGGLSSWNGTWERVAEEINARRTDLNYIAIDLPPFGFSVPDAKRGYFRGAQAERLAAFIDQKGIEHVIVVGHSYGAGPATEYAITHPDHINKLVIIDGVLNIDETKVVDKHSLIQSDILRTCIIGMLIHNNAFVLSRLKTFVYVTKHLDATLAGVYTRYFDTKGVTGRFSSWLKDYMNDPLQYSSNASLQYKTMPFPVRIIWGKEDTLTPISDTRVLLDTIPNVSLKALDGVGHIPMIEDYAQFDSALQDALAD